ncbi:MAG: hypothetical protein ACFCUT_17660 [Kiloniellaceae bacterium]
MLRTLFLVVALAATSACAQQRTTVYRLFNGHLEVAVSENYTLYERFSPNRSSGAPKDTGRAEFVTLGRDHAFSRKFPDYAQDPDFLDRFFGKGIQARMKIQLVELMPIGVPDEWEWREQSLVVPRDADDREIHAWFCGSFTTHWTEFSFTSFDPETGVGRCVNFAGAFVAIFTRRVDDTLVLIDSMDIVEFLLVEKKGPGKAVLEMSAVEKWQVFRAAANAEVTEQVLLSAKVH